MHDERLKELHAGNVLAGRHFWPGRHRMEPYRSNIPHAGLLLPRTGEIQAVCSIVHTVRSQAGAARRILAKRD